MITNGITQAEEARVAYAGEGRGYHVVAIPYRYCARDIQDVPMHERRAIAGPYTNLTDARTRASQENWRRDRPEATS